MEWGLSDQKSHKAGHPHISCEYKTCGVSAYSDLIMAWQCLMCSISVLGKLELLSALRHSEMFIAASFLILAFSTT